MRIVEAIETNIFLSYDHDEGCYYRIRLKDFKEKSYGYFRKEYLKDEEVIDILNK